MNISAIANAMTQGMRMPRFIRDSLRARILTGISIMLLPLLALAIAALLGINSVTASFKEVVEKVHEEIEPITALQIAIFQAAMPANDYLIHGESAERDKFARLSDKVERVFRRVEGGSSTHAEDRALIRSANVEWRQARLISERLLALPQPVGDTAAASDMKRMDAHVDRAVGLFGQLHELVDKEIEGEFTTATANGRTVLRAVFGVFALGFALAFSVGAAMAWSIVARVRALSEGARAFSEGNLSYRVRLEGHDELGQLASVFNAMAAELDKNHQALRETSIRDSLTGLCNRREFDRLLKEELQRCGRYRHPLSLLMLDIDHFKAINDGHGHPAGDKVLRGTADIIRGPARIRLTVAGHTFPIDNKPPLNVTVSVGVAAFPDDAGTDAALIAAADSALYAAKRMGRDRVCSFEAKSSVENVK